MTTTWLIRGEAGAAVPVTAPGSVPAPDSPLGQMEPAPGRAPPAHRSTHGEYCTPVDRHDRNCHCQFRSRHARLAWVGICRRLLSAAGLAARLLRTNLLGSNTGEFSLVPDGLRLPGSITCAPPFGCPPPGWPGLLRTTLLGSKAGVFSLVPPNLTLPTSMCCWAPVWLAFKCCFNKLTLKPLCWPPVWPAPGLMIICPAPKNSAVLGAVSLAPPSVGSGGACRHQACKRPGR